MKKVLFAGAGALALIMAASAAQAQDISTGYIGATYGNIDTLNQSFKVIGVDGTVAFDVSDEFEIQVDGQYASIDAPGAGGSSTIWGPTAHFFIDRNDFKAGAFIGYEDLDDVFGPGSTATGYGLEARYAAGENVTLGAVAAWGSINSDGQPDMDLSSYSATMSVFTSDNLRFDASYTRTTADWGPFSGETSVIGLGAEWKMENQPISFTLGYSTANSDLSGGDAATWSIGIRRVIGGSLKDRDRTSSPFHDMPFNFGGLGAILAAQGSVFQDVFRCFEEESCPSYDAIDSWLGGFDDENAEDVYCELFGCDED